MIWLFSLYLTTILGLIGWYSWKYGITPTPTSTKVKKEFLKILPQIRPEQVVAELGSGWGTLAFALAKKYPDNQICAYEISPVPYLVSQLIAWFLRYPNLRIERKNIFDISLANTALIVCYLYPEAMRKMKMKFEQELIPGTFVASHTFAVPGWKPVQCVKVDDLYQTPIYLYSY